MHIMKLLKSWHCMPYVAQDAQPCKPLDSRLVASLHCRNALHVALNAHIECASASHAHVHSWMSCHGVRLILLHPAK